MKIIILIGVAVLILIAIVVFFLFSGQQQTNEEKTTDKQKTSGEIESPEDSGEVEVTVPQIPLTEEEIAEEESFANNPEQFCAPYSNVEATLTCADAVVLALREVQADHGGDIRGIDRQIIEGTDMWVVTVHLDHPHFAEAFNQIISDALVGVRLDGADGPIASYRDIPGSE